MKKTKTYEQEILEWRWRQLYLRRKYNNTPAGFKSEEQERLARSLLELDVQRFRKGRFTESSLAISPPGRYLWEGKMIWREFMPH